MSEPGLIVIGSGAAGIGAAEAYREHRNDVPVRILTADVDAPYMRPPLSKEFLRGESDDVGVHTPEWLAERKLELSTGTRVDGIDVRDRVVTAAGRRFAYSELIVACGSHPRTLPVPGGDRALSLRSLRDAEELRRVAEQSDSAVVVGAGFIGCEAAASLAMRGVSVTLVAPGQVPQQKRFGVEVGERLRSMVEDAGARFVGGVRVQEITAEGVVLDNGVTVDTDLVVAATGVTPDSALAGPAGLSVEQARIVVDADMRTAQPGVFAAGDVALAANVAAGRSIAVEHWQDAADQGAVAGRRAAGIEAAWAQVPGFWSTIGTATVKYHAWGDGYDRCRLIDHRDGFTAWYESDGVAVGVLTHNADDDYELGEELIRVGESAPVAMS
ncbi:FAD/NAD(P)-binding oxidoreductase [Gordonia sp. PKS22-38]|uniref:FAD/NAD(P)-binding oxidoreductase n=1 Tax=Gordonia prachuapensis TaxID=3115651 RepID=A0ABU7MY72_9ACTN|nr:FAD/NAD(P)-binding oxidoreductase [Gordonia sp. PKS22-38]